MHAGDFIAANENKSRLYTDMLFEFFLSYDNSNSRDPESVLQGFFSFVKKICVSGVRRKVFVHLLVIRASCALILQRNLEIPMASVYRELNSLVGLGLVERVMPRRDGVGRPYSIFAVRGYRPEDVVEALHRAAAGRSPVYSQVRQVTQLIMEDYLGPRGLREISWREVLSETKAYCKGFYSGDVARLVVRELGKAGVKVWL